MIKIIFFLLFLNLKCTEINFLKKENNRMEVKLVLTDPNDYFSKTSKTLDVSYDGVVKETTSVLSNLYKFTIKEKFAEIKVFFDEGCRLPLFFTRKKTYLTDAVDLLSSNKLYLTSSNFAAKELNLKTNQSFKIADLGEKPPKNLLNQKLYIKDGEEHEGIIFCPIFVSSKTIFSFRVDAQLIPDFKEHFDKEDIEKKFNIIIPPGEKISKKLENLEEETNISFEKSTNELLVTFKTSNGKQYEDDGSIFFLENLNYIEIEIHNPTKKSENVEITYITSDCISCFGQHHKEKSHLVVVFIILGILILIIIVALLYYYYRTKKKINKNLLKREENGENEFKVEGLKNVEEIDINDKELQNVYDESLNISNKTFEEKDMKFYK